MQKNSSDSQYDRMTQAPVGGLLFSLSVPTIITMTVTNLYNIADTAFVGTLGTSESGATGIVFGFMAILQAVAFMCGQGAGSIMSRKLGQKNQEEALKYCSTGFFFSFCLGLVIAAISFMFFTPLVFLLGSTETIAPFAKQYIFFILLSAPFFTSSYTMNNLLRYEGKAKLGTVALMSGAVLNIAGDAILIFVFKLGVRGAGIATAVSQFISFSLLLSMYIRGKTQVKISFRYIARDFSTFWEIASTGFPSLLRQGLNTIATMLLNRSASLYGDAAVSAMSIVSRVCFFPMSVAIGIGQGFQPISAFNYGARKPDRVIKAFWSAMTGAVCAVLAMAVPLFVFAGFFVRLLRDDPAVVEIAVRALRLQCVAQVFVPTAMMVEMGFQSIGKKFFASLGSSLRSGIVFIPTLLIMARIRGLSGIQESQPLSILITFVIMIFLCRSYIREVNKAL
ncbi:MAG: MATE family efflux transporter [Treponemataceae bacterium]|nr:MATE family efflux transporter [Treponemataceae bacterium]